MPKVRSAVAFDTPKLVCYTVKSRILTEFEMRHEKFL